MVLGTRAGWPCLSRGDEPGASRGSFQLQPFCGSMEYKRIYHKMKDKTSLIIHLNSKVTQGPARVNRYSLAKDFTVQGLSFNKTLSGKQFFKKGTVFLRKEQLIKLGKDFMSMDLKSKTKTILLLVLLQEHCGSSNSCSMQVFWPVFCMSYIN